MLMIDFFANKRIVSFIMAVFFIFSTYSFSAFAANEDVSEDNTYVLNRDGNGEPLYTYQSPCMIGYDLNNKYGGNGVPIQAFIYTMYNEITGEHFPTYCGDINISAIQGTDYRRLNLEDSSFSANSAGRVRAILQEGFYIIPESGESDADHAARVAAKTLELAAASGAEGLTTGEAIAATQAAIWQVVHGSTLSFPKFCRYVFNPTNTKYSSLCSYNELRYKNNNLINSTIETAFNYLVSLSPVAAEEKTVSAASFTDLNDPVFTQNADGSYNISVTTTIDVQITEDDTLTLKAELGDSYTAEANLVNGKQTLTLNLENVPVSLISEDVILSISGYQTAKGYFLFDASGDRGASQTMVGYNEGQLPVHASVIATEDRILNVNKTAVVAMGDNSYERRPLSNISFDIFPVATKDEYLSGTVTLPDAKDYVHPEIADYIITTDENGQVSMNFLHFDLPDGVYLVVEHPHPSIVAPIEPFYLHLPATDPETGEVVYEVTIKPKNDVKGGVHIGKDVGSVGNDALSVGVHEKVSWIISSTIPDDIATGASYSITDTLDNRLDYLGNLVVVLENSNESPVPLSAGTDYTLTVTDADSLSENKPSDSFKIELTVNGMNKIANTIGDNDFNSYILRVYFDTQINANAEMGTPIPNQAEVKYTNAVNFEFAEKSDTPTVYTGGVNLLKVDGKDTSKTLSGAVFELYRTATQEEVGAGDSRLTEILGVPGKVIKVEFYDNAALSGNKVSTVISDGNGKVSIYGLSYGTYYLVETKAPSGYNALGGTLNIIINEDSHKEENAVIVKNDSGMVLPTTGGRGTTLYTVGGISLLCFAGVLIYFKRKSVKA